MGWELEVAVDALYTVVWSPAGEYRSVSLSLTVTHGCCVGPASSASLDFTWTTEAFWMAEGLGSR